MCWSIVPSILHNALLVEVTKKAITFISIVVDASTSMFKSPIRVSFEYSTCWVQDMNKRLRVDAVMLYFGRWRSKICDALSQLWKCDEHW